MDRIAIDTRDRKPTLYNLLLLTCAVLAAAGWMLLYAGNHSAAVSVLLELYFMTAFALLLSALVKQLQYNPYSYNTILYTGFALFVAFVLVIDTVLVIRTLRNPGVYWKTDLLDWMVSASKIYILVTMPCILAFSVFLCLSNVFLIRREGKRLVNILGILFSFLLTGGALLIICLDRFLSAGNRGSAAWAMCVNILVSVYFYLECMLFGAMAASLIAVRCRPAYDRDYMIILGCGLKEDGTPTPLLRGRIDSALRFYREQKAATGRELTFVVSGGKGRDEVMTESASMKQYLLSQGIPENQILEEDQSSSTFENMKFSKAKILENGYPGNIAFATTNYHVFRSGLCARRVKMRAIGVGAGTKWYFWPNAWVREFAGLLTEHRGKQALVLGGLVLANILLTLYAMA